jgi:type II secretory ATPase GspE/PulE/Tfp pilus assembly ATPase PilB-like protein
MGIEKYLILETLNLIIAQRLVRKVCGICNMINTERCESCRHTGYDGRTIIAEIIDITKLRKEKNMRTLEVFDIDDYIKSLEYISLEKDAKEKISKGITTLLEMKRVL